MKAVLENGPAQEARRSNPRLEQRQRLTVTSAFLSLRTGSKFDRESEIKRLYYVDIAMDAACNAPWTRHLDLMNS